jgi:uncharacterized protein YjiS (DUF1127 family)
VACDSTTSSFPYRIDAPSRFFQDVRWWKIPLAWVVAWERRCRYKQLLELDDRLLADIGMSRTTVEEVRRSALYLAAWRDSR